MDENNLTPRKEFSSLRFTSYSNWIPMLVGIVKCVYR